MLLAAGTGTGKTRAAMLPLLKRGEWGLAVYPTNELVRDQVRALAKMADEEGVAATVWTPEVWASQREKYGCAPCVLTPLDGALLDEWQEVTGERNRGETLFELLRPDKPKIVLTNPDILFLILGLRYHAEPLEALRRYGTLVVDEFHLYQGVELAHALVMVALARGLGMFSRVLLLSATPDPEVRKLLDLVLEPTVVEPEKAHDQKAEDERVSVHGVEVAALQVAAEDPVEILSEQICQRKAELERLRRETSQDSYLPAVAIVNSVVNAIRLEDRLVEEGFQRDSLGIIRGLSHRAIRGTEGKLLVLGTSAIEVGVDFHSDYLFFEASESASFLQRFGRVGRHRPGKAVVLVPPNVFHGMRRMGSEVERSEFEARIHAWYRSADARPWFAATEYGMITARSLAHNLLRAAADDPRARPEVVDRLRDRIEAILDDHAHRLGCEAKNRAAERAFRRCGTGRPSAQWLDAYCRLNRFRTSVPSVRVHDFTEEGRRGEWILGEYEADLATLLKRAVGLCWNERLNMLTIRGIGKYRRVHLSEIFSDDLCGQILETQHYPRLRFYQDGESTPVSDIMSRENHTFAVVRKADVKSGLDWRLPVFESGDYLVGFDGAGLMLLEIARAGRKLMLATEGIS